MFLELSLCQSSLKFKGLDKSWPPLIECPIWTEAISQASSHSFSLMAMILNEMAMILNETAQMQSKRAWLQLEKGPNSMKNGCSFIWNEKGSGLN